MRRLLLLVLLISLGLNVGLAWRLRQAATPAPGTDLPDGPRWEHGGRFRPAADDTQAWRERMERRFSRLSERLDLDPRQREAFRRHRERVERDVLARTTLLEAARGVLRDEAMRRPPRPAEVASALAAVGRAEAGLDSLVAANLQAELEMLDPRQQAELLRMLPFERMGHRRGYGRGDGPGAVRGRRNGGGNGAPDGGSGGGGGE